MEDIRQDCITAFDACFTNNQIRMFKALLPYLEPSMQKNIAIYIKFMELQYTLQYWKQPSHNHTSFPCSAPKEKSFDFGAICDALLPYCSIQEKQQFAQIRNLFQTMQRLQDMTEMIETMKELFPEGMSNGSEGGFNPETLAAMSSMFGGGDMDLSGIMDMFSGMSG